MLSGSNILVFLLRMLLLCVVISWKTDFFRVHMASSKHEGELGQFETIMQTQEFSQTPRVFI